MRKASSIILILISGILLPIYAQSKRIKPAAEHFIVKCRLLTQTRVGQNSRKCLY